MEVHNMKIYFAHGWNDNEKVECQDGWGIVNNHPAHVKKADILIFKLNEGEISKGILNEIQAAQEANIPIYLLREGRGETRDGRRKMELTNDPKVLAALPLRKWKRNFSNISHPFRDEK